MSHCSHKDISDTKFESGSFFRYGDMTSQNSSLNKRISHQIRVFTPGKINLTFKK